MKEYKNGRMVMVPPIKSVRQVTCRYHSKQPSTITLAADIGPLTDGRDPLTLRGMDQPLSSRLRPGSRVKVTQQIAARDYAWISEVTGTVVSYEQKQTGSWFAHSRGDKLWLDRLTLKKPDGELTTLILDEFSNIEVEDEK
jgi:hypothetical protein